MTKQLLSAGVLGLCGFVGILAFAYPFFLPALEQNAGWRERGGEAPLLTTILLVLCLMVLLLEMQGTVMSAKQVALLGMLVAIASALRFLEVAVPLPSGFSPIFVPIILAGYVFGARFGFLMGVMSLLVSGLATGGVGPWLPFQMFTAGWVGLTAGWLPHPAQPRWQLAWLMAWGALWGLLYGAILNLYLWPFLLGETEMSWQAGLGWRDGLARYATFYVVTSLWWDVVRAVGNVALLWVVGETAVRTLTRWHNRFTFQRVAP